MAASTASYAGAPPDLITTLQQRLDELATQLYAALRYATTHHPSIANSALANTVINPPHSGTSGQPTSPPAQQQPSHSFAQSQSQQQQQSQQSQNQGPASPSHIPHAPESFESDLAELASDLVAKQRELEDLIAKLPVDLDIAREGQEQRIRELAAQMGDLEGQAERLGQRREEASRRVEGVIGRFRKV